MNPTPLEVSSEGDPEAAAHHDKDELQKVGIKIAKVKDYWDERSMLIPNVFRLLCEFESASVHLLEFQDLSNKIVLVQGSSQKGGGEEEETKATVAKTSKERRHPLKAKAPLKGERAHKKRPGR